MAFLAAGCAPSARLAVGVRPGTAPPSWSSDPQLKAGIDSLLSDTLFPPASLGIEIASAESGEILYTLNPGYLYLPASNQKLLTSATALATLGQQFTYETRTFFDTTVSPRIFIKGSGDPILSSQDLDSLAGRTAASLPPGRRWTVCADISMFDDLQWGKGWMWDDEPSSDAMYITPLSVNNNCITVRVTPADSVGKPPHVACDPPTHYVTVQNTATTVSDTVRVPLDISRNWRDRSNTITVKGEILASDREEKNKISLWQPEWYALTLFRQAVESRGIQCEGMVTDTVPTKAVPVSSVVHGLDTVMTYMNKVSDNLSAENLLRTAAVVRFGAPGTAANGMECVMQFLTSMGIDTTRVVSADGSGVSRYNLVSPSLLVHLLIAMAHDEQRLPFWYSTLPVAGVDGTLSERMKGTAAEGNVHAKTGTLDGVTTLSGYAHSRGGRLLAFSIMIQGFAGNTRAYRKIQDKICVFLCGGY